MCNKTIRDFSTIHYQKAMMPLSNDAIRFNIIIHINKIIKNVEIHHYGNRRIYMSTELPS